MLKFLFEFLQILWTRSAFALYGKTDRFGPSSPSGRHASRCICARCRVMRHNSLHHVAIKPIHTYTYLHPHSLLQLIEPCCFLDAAHMHIRTYQMADMLMRDVCGDMQQACLAVCVDSMPLWSAPPPTRSTLLLPLSLGNVTYVYQTRSDAQARVTRKRSLSFPPWPAYDRAWETMLGLICLPGVKYWLLGCFVASLHCLV